MRTLIAKVAALTIAAAGALSIAGPAAALGQSRHAGNGMTVLGHRTHLVVSNLHDAMGSTVGPDGALYVADGVDGVIYRVDPKTAHTTTFAWGLPRQMTAIGVGGAMDIAFIHHTAYVLVTLVSPDVGGADVDGIYRVDGPNDFTVVADIGAWSTAHPPIPAFVVPSGVQFALQPYRGAFLVTDGHHNRVLRVTTDGQISERMTFADIVPTGLAVRGGTVYLAEAGPVPHLPQDGTIVRFGPRSSDITEVASGAPLLVDVEFGCGGGLYALSQGHFTPGHPAGSPADPRTGALERVNRNGTMTPIATELNQPTSLEFIGNTAYVVTLTGGIWAIDCG